MPARGVTGPELSMTAVRLTCPAGHTWEHPLAEPVPADLRAACPVCALASQDTPGPPQPAAAAGDAPAPARPLFGAAALTPGQVVAGFEIIEEINRGGMGVIYKARQIAMNRLVAFKAINPVKLEVPGTRARFDAEVKASARLNHPNIVTVYQADLDGPIPYLAMEYVPGIDLLR